MNRAIQGDHGDLHGVLVIRISVGARSMSPGHDPVHVQ